MTSILSAARAAILLLAVVSCGSATPAGSGAAKGCPNGTNAECASPTICDVTSKTCVAPQKVTGGTTTPTIVSNTPLDSATDVAINTSASITFSEAMDPTTFTAFTLTAGVTPVAGTVTYASSTATFWPTAHLASSTAFTATITTATKSAAGVALATGRTWHFMTGTTVAPGLPVSLGGSGSFVILAKSGIDSVPPSTIIGDLGVSPAASTAITHFSLAADASGSFAISSQVTGKVYAADDASPTPTTLTAAVSDMQLAFTDAAGRAPDVTELGAGSIGSQTLVPGVYQWSTGLQIPTDLTLSGDATAVWIFQIAQGLTVANGTQITLAGGALPKNVFWQVSGAVTLGTTSHFEGIVLCQTAVTMETGSSINGRLFAQTAVNLQSTTVTQPAP